MVAPTASESPLMLSKTCRVWTSDLTSNDWPVADPRYRAGDEQEVAGTYSLRSWSNGFTACR